MSPLSTNYTKEQQEEISSLRNKLYDLRQKEITLYTKLRQTITLPARMEQNFHQGISIPDIMCMMISWKTRKSPIITTGKIHSFSFIGKSHLS